MLQSIDINARRTNVRNRPKAVMLIGFPIVENCAFNAAATWTFTKFTAIMSEQPIQENANRKSKKRLPHILIILSVVIFQTTSKHKLRPSSSLLVYHQPKDHQLSSDPANISGEMNAQA